jgi:two-component system, NarL family, invasion response regulator UvrY
MSTTPAVQLAVVDDHTLFRKGLISLIDMLNEPYEILFEAENGIDLQHKISKEKQPDILLLDINMPKMDGLETVRWLNQEYPLVKILVVSMVEAEETVLKMLRYDIKGYLCKDVEPAELSAALKAVSKNGFYYTDYITGKLVHSLKYMDLRENPKPHETFKLNEREFKFIQLACSDDTYQQIAGKMFLSPKTIDGYREVLFQKFNVKSRVGLALYAVKHGLVTING